MTAPVGALRIRRVDVDLAGGGEAQGVTGVDRDPGVCPFPGAWHGQTGAWTCTPVPTISDQAEAPALLNAYTRKHW
jgi:hypothetical protein